MKITHFLVAFAAFGICSHGIAKGPKITDPKKAGADFAIQGEYAGVLSIDGNEIKIGAQVIALGDGKFKSVGHFGGLPGDGWNGEERHEVEGAVTDAGVRFDNDEAQAVIKNGEMTVKVSGQTVGTLKKMERKSPTLGAKPPEGAVVLFDGKDAKHWKDGKVSDDGLLMQGTSSIPTFQSHKLHIEFRIPYQPEDRGQGRGNSGIYLQGRYEVQMLDSFGLEGKNNECGGIYSIKDPDVNMCFPPLAWQTYDIDFTAAQYDADGKVTANPRVTVKHNGVVIHKNVELPKSTTASPMKPGTEAGPIYLQNHGCPVHYRNIWVQKL